MIAVTVTGHKEVATRLAAVARELPASLERDVARAGLTVAREVRRGLTGPSTRHPFWGKGGGQGATLGRRSGGTITTVVGGRVHRVGNTVMTSVGTSAPHVKLHEDGGTVRNARIPTAAAQMTSGKDRNAGRSLRGVPGIRFFKSKAGNLWAYRRDGKKTTLLYMFKSVTFRPRKMWAAATERARPVVERLLGEGVLSIVRRANGA